jgi:hypothetical protein
MAWVSFGLAMAALVAALIASWFWYQSAMVRPPMNLAVNQFRTGIYINQLNMMLIAVARLNRNAAIWTAVASILSALSAVMSAL